MYSIIDAGYIEFMAATKPTPRVYFGRRFQSQMVFYDLLNAFVEAYVFQWMKQQFTEPT